MIDVVCGACGKRVKVKAEHAGERYHCPDCGLMVRVPKPQSVAAAAAAPPPPARIANGEAIPPGWVDADPIARWVPGDLYQKAVLLRLDWQIALLARISWHLSGVWWFLLGSIIFFLAGFLVLAVLVYWGALLPSPR